MARRSVKRRTFAKTKRSKNKCLKSMLIWSAAWKGTMNEDLYTATYPVTISGLRWQLNFSPYITNMVNINCVYGWILYVLEEGEQYKEIALSNGNDGVVNYTAGEQNVICWGKGFCMGNDIARDADATKSMRKLQSGDRLVLSIKWGTGNIDQSPDPPPGITFSGVVQFFTIV